jgi:predicted TPR repeat methyltransferase
LRRHGDRLATAGRLEEAAAAYRSALAYHPDDPELQTNLGNVLLGLGRPDQAVAAYRAVLATGFDHPLIQYNLGTALRALEQSEAALAAFQAALAQAPDFPPAYNNCGNTLRDLGRHAEAAAAYLEALVRRPGDGGTRVNLASALSLLHQQDPAAAAALARRWHQLDADTMAGHVVAALTGGPAPERAADGYVRQLFDGFAADFERRLGALDYQVPALVAATLERWWPVPGGALTVLDAGCGTGLCAPALRSHAETLVGIDLSSAMLERAQARRLYDELEVAELTAFLAEQPARFDLIVAADVLCYFGVLGGVLTAAAAALRPGGRLLFTLERDPDPAAPPFTLQANGRYRHAPATLPALLTAAGLEPATLNTASLEPATLNTAGLEPATVTEVVLRQEGAHAVPGLLVETARRP